MSLQFDPADPFPLIVQPEATYAEQKLHAEAADIYLGYRVREIEGELLSQFQSQAEVKKAQWIGLDPASLQTPYTELRYMLTKLGLKAGDTVVDLGAAYGRMGLVMNEHHAGCNFIGIEIAKKRAEEGTRIFRKYGAQRAAIFSADATVPEFILPEAQCYFIYDLSVLTAIKQVLGRLKEKSREERVCIIGRGRATRDQIERKEAWLTQIIPPVHYTNFTVYRSR